MHVAGYENHLKLAEVLIQSVDACGALGAIEGNNLLVLEVF